MEDKFIYRNHYMHKNLVYIDKEDHTNHLKLYKGHLIIHKYKHFQIHILLYFHRVMRKSNLNCGAIEISLIDY